MSTSSSDGAAFGARHSSWYSRLLSSFPLHIYEAPPPASSSTPSQARPAQRPRLYILPPHPAQAASTWASADPRCLRLQLELLFRSGGDKAKGTTPAFDVVFVDPRVEDLVWGPGGQLPFLHLPTGNAGGSSSGAQTSQRNPAGRLVGVSGLDHWLDNYHPYPWDRPELDEKSPPSRPYGSDALKAEAASWQVLLETKVFAGVLMQKLTLPAPSPRPTQQPALITGILASALRPSALYQLSLLRRLSALIPLHPTSHPSPIPAFFAWLAAAEFSHPFSLPGGGASEQSNAANIGKSELEREEEIGDFARAGEWRSCRSERDEANLLNLALQEGSGSYTDILRAACDAIEAIGTRFEAEGDGADGKWALNAEAPAPLDALLFSLLHTILSLPVDHAQGPAPPRTTTHEGAEDDDPAYAIRAPARTLREAVQRHPVLMRWTRRVWLEHVKTSTLFHVVSSDQ
ncbi:hypothetical protein V8E36_007446 [Tilletia maclaganii]